MYCIIIIHSYQRYIIWLPKTSSSLTGRSHALLTLFVCQGKWCNCDSKSESSEDCHRCYENRSSTGASILNGLGIDHSHSTVQRVETFSKSNATQSMWTTQAQTTLLVWTHIGADVGPLSPYIVRQPQQSKQWVSGSWVNGSNGTQKWDGSHGWPIDPPIHDGKLLYFN